MLLIKMEIYFMPSSLLSQIQTSRAGSVCENWAQLCLILCDLTDCSPPASSVHGVVQARILEWVAISSSWRYSQPRDRTHVSGVSDIGRQISYHWVIWKVQTFDSTSAKSLACAKCLKFDFVVINYSKILSALKQNCTVI